MDEDGFKKEAYQKLNKTTRNSRAKLEPHKISDVEEDAFAFLYGVAVCLCKSLCDCFCITNSIIIILFTDVQLKFLLQNWLIF